MNVVYLNGEFLNLQDAKIPVLDRGFLFGDGVYEVIPAYHGRLFRLEQHLERLTNSLNAIRIHLPLAQSELKEILQKLVENNGGGNISVYFQITRGVDSKRDHAFPPPDVLPTLFGMTQPIPDNQLLTPTARAISAVTVVDDRWANCQIKAITLLANVLHRQHALDEGAKEAILVRDGFAIEGAASNLFIVQSGTLITPPKSQYILGGITRDLILELAAKKNIPTEEKNIPLASLYEADEVWLTNSTKEIQPVICIDGRPIGHRQERGEPGPLWCVLNEMYEAFKRCY